MSLSGFYVWDDSRLKNAAKKYPEIIYGYTLENISISGVNFTELSKYIKMDAFNSEVIWNTDMYKFILEAIINASLTMPSTSLNQSITVKMIETCSVLLNSTNQHPIKYDIVKNIKNLILDYQLDNIQLQQLYNDFYTLSNSKSTDDTNFNIISMTDLIYGSPICYITLDIKSSKRDDIIEMFNNFADTYHDDIPHQMLFRLYIENAKYLMINDTKFIQEFLSKLHKKGFTPTHYDLLSYITDIYSPRYISKFNETLVNIGLTAIECDIVNSSHLFLYGDSQYESLYDKSILYCDIQQKNKLLISGFTHIEQHDGNYLTGFPCVYVEKKNIKAIEKMLFTQNSYNLRTIYLELTTIISYSTSTVNSNTYLSIARNMFAHINNKISGYKFNSVQIDDIITQFTKMTMSSLQCIDTIYDHIGTPQILSKIAGYLYLAYCLLNMHNKINNEQICFCTIAPNNLGRKMCSITYLFPNKHGTKEIDWTGGYDINIPYKFPDNYNSNNNTSKKSIKPFANIIPFYFDSETYR
jgi:hypothetical protein